MSKPRGRNRSPRRKRSQRAAANAARLARILPRLGELQARLAGYWGAVSLASGASFTTRLQSFGARLSSTEGYGAQLWRLWIECAEQAYAQTVHEEGFSKTFAEWLNTGARAIPYTGCAGYVLTTRSPVSREVASGCSLSRVVWRNGPASLHRILPLPFTRHSRSRPVLVCYALVNHPYILDLNPQCSWVRGLVASGRDVYVIEWHDPPRNERLELADYVERYLGDCVRFVLDTHRIQALDLIGVCQGGTFSLCYAALHPRRIANLVTLTTPVDFQTPDDLLSKWARGLDTHLLERYGTIPAQVLCGVFLLLKPFKLTCGKYLELLERCQDPRGIEEFLRIEHWTRDGLPQSAKALAQFVKWFYQENRLVRGTLELAGHRVSLGRIFQPVLNIFALRDHIVPPAASRALQHVIGSKDYCAHAVDAGHVGIYVSRRCSPAARARLVSWLDERR